MGGGKRDKTSLDSRRGERGEERKLKADLRFKRKKEFWNNGREENGVEALFGHLNIHFFFIRTSEIKISLGCP